MFANLELDSLQEYWWFVVSLLGALLVFMLFVQGGQTFIFRLGKTATHRNLIINALGRKWELTFTTLVTFGGAFFASFPLFYATSFSGAYWVWMLILFAYVVQAVSYEYRSKPHNFLGQIGYESLLFINGLLGTVLLGAAVSTFFTGASFQLNEMNFPHWTGSMHGLEAILDWRNVALGLAIFFLSRTQALLFFLNSFSDPELLAKVRKQILPNALPFVLIFVAWIVGVFSAAGFAYNPQTLEVSYLDYKYLHNLVEMPLVAILLLMGVLSVLVSIGLSLRSKQKATLPFWLSGAGIVAVVLALLLLVGYNDTIFYPSLTHLQSSLSIRNASSSRYTLLTMAYVSMLVPVVILYIAYVWRVLSRKPMDNKELDTENHIY
ncbi:MAG: hypothetical protein RIS47_1016 [Bacteroidota bacterium]